jgi:hypothetical protein
VAVLLYYDGRKALVQALKTLVAGRTGSTWSTDTQPDMAELGQETTAGLMAGGLADTLLQLLAILDWTMDLAALQKASALGDAHTVAGLHADIRQGLADCLYRYSAPTSIFGGSGATSAFEGSGTSSVFGSSRASAFGGSGASVFGGSGASAFGSSGASAFGGSAASSSVAPTSEKTPRSVTINFF